jgi:4-amino-4-deoxy-L-arabinose transferase-like glycosyltransferase
MTHPAAKKDAFTQLLLATLVVIILLRFALLGSYPLLGTTEPRYAELARKMLATGDWVTLWVLDGVPLWGKPPLLFWLDTISMRLFGVNEFAVRLPPFLASLATLSLLWFWPTKSSKMPLIAGLIYISTPVGFLATGFVATDIFLAGCLWWVFGV